jgi:glycosyltransferase involved in cell wall biosynthesis
MLAVHKAMSTWQTKVHLYIAISEFARQKFVQGGLPSDRLVVKPNFVYPDPGAKTKTGDYALFAGRLSHEKGLRVLLQAWSRLAQPIPLYIAGDGPMRDEIHAAMKVSPEICLLGHLPRIKVLEYMRGARFLISPSLCFEAFGIAVAEAFACGVPVIVPRLGSLEEIVEDGRTGLYFAPDDADDLAGKAQWAWTHTHRLDDMGRQARREFELKYTAGQNYASLIQIYAKARTVAGRSQITSEIMAPTPATWSVPRDTSKPWQP